MALTKTELPEISGEYSGSVKLVKKLVNSRLVRGREYPISLELGYENIQDVESFFGDLGESGILLKLIADHGLVIVRGLGSTDSGLYSAIVRRFFAHGFHEFEQVGLLAVREKVKDAVSTVGNDDKLGKNLGKLASHQEFSRYLEFPGILTFFAQKAPRLEGGESTTTHATELFDKVAAKYPQFIRDLYEKGGNHVWQRFNYEVKNDSQFKISWTDKGAFGKYITQQDLDKGDIEALKQKALRVAEERVSKNVEFDGNDLILHQINDIALIHPVTGLPVLFSSLPTYYAGFYKGKAPMPPLTYGNGEKIPREYLDYLYEQSVELEYTHRFEDGDILFLDNLAVYHGRNPYTVGDRTILASFWESNEPLKPLRPENFTEFSK